MSFDRISDPCGSWLGFSFSFLQSPLLIRAHSPAHTVCPGVVNDFVLFWFLPTSVSLYCLATNEFSFLQANINAGVSVTPPICSNYRGIEFLRTVQTRNDQEEHDINGKQCYFPKSQIFASLKICGLLDIVKDQRSNTSMRETKSFCVEETRLTQSLRIIKREREPLQFSFWSH